jgi:glycerol-3-phosphate acyltransferase PlsY
VDRLTYALLTLGSYFLGAVPFGVLVARARGIDIMSVGSGNTGATNVARVLGWKLGLTVFVLDVLKGVVPCVVASALTGKEEASIIMGVVAVIGHTFSPFLRFKGGKGVATSLGVLFGATPLVGAIALAAFVAMFLTTRIVSVSSLFAAVAVLVSGWLMGQPWFFFAVFGPLTLYLFVRHRANIGRLLKGEEPKLDLKKKLDTQPGDQGPSDKKE